MEMIAAIENLRVKFPNEKDLLFKDLSLSIQKGERILLLGPSGCGKSTLLQVLSGLIPHTIEVPMKAEKLQIPLSWGYVFQDPDSQFCMPYVDEELAFVLENLQIPREHMRVQINKYLQQVGLQLENIHTEVNMLSGGMKQRLAIASVLALEPQVLFLDEPTAMLDPIGTKEIWDVMKTVSEEKTIIIVEHKIEQVLDFVTRIILFNECGQIIADGSKEHILTHNKNEMRDHGIWYPGAWEEYMKNRKIVSDFSIENRDNTVIALQNFKGYRQKKMKIEVNELNVCRGEWIVIKGENGAGKSTFLHSLMQFLKTTGHYVVNGRTVKKGSKLTDFMTFVFQNPEFQFVTNSVYEEIAYSLKIEKRNQDEINDKVEELLELFSLSSHRDKHPYQLSMGQKRRLSVAASLVKGQSILLLDEPTFGQDAKNTFRLLELFEELCHDQTTVIMVTHDEKIEEHFATRALTIQNGTIIQDRTITRKLGNLEHSVVPV